MRELVCIVCPNGCQLKITGEGKDIVVEGAKCKKGKTFALEEITCPKRTICTTMKTIYEEVPVIPVRTASEIPKELIMDLMVAVNSVTIKKVLPRGSVVIKNVLNTGVDIITTSDMKKYGIDKKGGSYE